MENLSRKLLKMKEEIESAKVEKNREEGKLDGFIKHMKRKFKCKDEKTMDRKIDGDGEEIERDERALERGVRKLEDHPGMSKFISAPAKKPITGQW